VALRQPCRGERHDAVHEVIARGDVSNIERTAAVLVVRGQCASVVERGLIGLHGTRGRRTVRRGRHLGSCLRCGASLIRRSSIPLVAVVVQPAWPDYSARRQAEHPQGSVEPDLLVGAALWVEQQRQQDGGEHEIEDAREAVLEGEEREQLQCEYRPAITTPPVGQRRSLAMK